jgi:hypothetical protein
MKPTKYVATIHFSTDGKTDVENLMEQAADRMEQVFSVDVTDTNVEEIDDDDQTTTPNA